MALTFLGITPGDRVSGMHLVFFWIATCQFFITSLSYSFKKCNKLW